MINNSIPKFIALLAVLFFSAPYVFAANTGYSEGRIWAEKFGYIAMGGSAGGEPYRADVAEAALSGYAWSEKTGWINFNDAGSYYAVAHDGAGNLSGYAWSEKLGYISFDDGSVNNYYQVTLDACSEMNQGGAVIFKGGTVFKGTAIMQPGKEGMCFTGYAWSEKGGYINFDDAGGLYEAVTDWSS